MKLSEAIRLGAMRRPQAFGARTDGVGTCAFGAAREAIGEQDGFVAEIWPELEVVVACPECGGAGETALSLVSNHLNDKHRWTREHIADWVATIEAQQEVHPATAPASADQALAEAKA